MKIKCGGLLFTSDFDSGNLHKVEHVSPSNEIEMEACASTSDNYLPKYRFTRQQVNRHVSKSSPVHTKKHFKKGVLSSQTKIVDTSECFPSPKPLQPILEFKVWTKPDCSGTPYETTFRTWFYFGVQGGTPGSTIKINVMNLNRQGKLYFHGMKPVFKVTPSKEDWKRIPGKVDFRCEPEGNFIISFCHTLPLEGNSVTYFAFTYPYSYSECQNMLDEFDAKFGSSLFWSKSKSPENAIYYCRELLCYSSMGNKVDLLTITSSKGLTMEREKNLPDLFPDSSKPRCHIFKDKKVIFISSRIHPGETPSSFVFNGMLQYLLCSKDSVANRLRNLYVFKLIPMLNPDGVHQGHYRADVQGLNLNRVYMIANFVQHPSIYAARTLLLHYHTSYSSPVTLPGSNLLSNLKKSKSSQAVEKPLRRLHKAALNTTSKKLSKETFNQIQKKLANRKHSFCDILTQNLNFVSTTGLPPVIAKSKSNLSESLTVGNSPKKSKRVPAISVPDTSNISLSSNALTTASDCKSPDCPSKQEMTTKDETCNCVEPSDAEDSSSFISDMNEGDASKLLKDVPCLKPEESGIAYFLDLHGHASKRGCFIYGNYFPDVDKMVECMFLPKLMSINCPYFDFSACNFSAENMYSGTNSNIQSKEGSGRVSLYVLTGIVRSYTLECNYNTCRFTMNQKRLNDVKPIPSPVFFTPEIFQQVGEALLVSILDASGCNPKSKICHSPFLSLQGVKEWLRQHALSVKGRCTSDVKVKDTNMRTRCEGKAAAMSMILRKSPMHLQSSSKALPRESSSSTANLSSNASDSEAGKSSQRRRTIRTKPTRGTVSLMSSPVSQHRTILQRRHTFSQDTGTRQFRKPTTFSYKTSPS